MKTYIIWIIVVLIGIGIIVFVRNSFFRLGKAVNKDISNSYYYHARKNIIVYAPSGNWFELGYTELEADSKSFHPISEEFGKDKEFIFWRGKKQKVDYATFFVDKDFIARDAKHVYSTTDDYGKPIMAVIEGADPKTYRLFDTGIDNWDRYWHKDGAHYFYKNKIIDADYNTFQRINHTLALDKDSIYIILNTTSVEPQSKDSKTIIKKQDKPQGEVRVINNNYALIGNSLILSNWKTAFAIIPFPKIDNINVIDDRNIVINDQLISDGKLYGEIDVATFKVLDKDYFKDKNHVYFDKQLIVDCNPRTFEMISEYYSKDSKQMYYKTQLLAKASPANFTYDYGTGEGTDGKLKFKNGIQVQD